RRTCARARRSSGSPRADAPSAARRSATPPAYDDTSERRPPRTRNAFRRAHTARARPRPTLFFGPLRFAYHAERAGVDAAAHAAGGTHAAPRRNPETGSAALVRRRGGA